METRIERNANAMFSNILSDVGAVAQIKELKEERLPFTVRVVKNEEDMAKAIQIRQSAYARHVPEIAALLMKPEPFDYDDGSIVLLAESKLDGSALGSMRLQTNRYQKLKLEASVDLPDWLKGQTLAESARLGVVRSGIGRLVKTIMFKAYFMYCLREKIDWIVLTARPVLDKQYETLWFRDVFPESKYIPMKHDANIPHRVMALNVPTIEPGWKQAGHPLYDLFFKTVHPDIQMETRAAVTVGEPHRQVAPAVDGRVMGLELYMH